MPLPEAGGAHCKFAGIETPCGACIAAKCIEHVDACCADDACGGVIKSIDSCASRGEGCAELRSRTDGAHRELSACISSQCGQACGAATVANVTSCKPAYVTSVDACSCELSATPNDAPCTLVNHPRLRCCAPEGWPAPALACECLSIICVPISDGCVCHLTGIDDEGRPTECRGTYCCVDSSATRCSCSPRPCVPGDTEVAACNVDRLTCGSGRHAVDTCSVPKP